MHPKVEDFLQKAKEEELKKRQDRLIELGLYEEIEVSNDTYNRMECITDKETGVYVYKYYKWIAVDVSDEEYEMILKHSHSNKQNLNYKNGAEQFINVINTIILMIGIVAAIVLVFTGFAIYGIYSALITTIFWAVIKVALNISNNLHQINAKLK